jgi:hypothetical protein
MGKVVVGLSMSLDGFIAQPDDEAGPLHDWHFTGDTTSHHDEDFRVPEPSREVFDQVFETMGRRSSAAGPTTSLTAGAEALRSPAPTSC